MKVMKILLMGWFLQFATWNSFGNFSIK